MNLICKQVEKQIAEIEALETEVTQCENDLENISGSAIRMKSYRIFLQKISHSKIANLEIVHQNKLDRLYGGQVFIKIETEPVINLANIDLNPIVPNAVSLGLKCHLKSRYDPLIKNLELKRLLKQIKTEASNRTIEIADEDRLKCELKRFGLRENNCHDKDLLTREQYIKFPIQ